MWFCETWAIVGGGNTCNNSNLFTKHQAFINQMLCINHAAGCPMSSNAILKYWRIFWKKITMGPLLTKVYAMDKSPANNTYATNLCSSLNETQQWITVSTWLTISTWITIQLFIHWWLQLNILLIFLHPKTITAYIVILLIILNYNYMNILSLQHKKQWTREYELHGCLATQACMIACPTHNHTARIR